MDVCIEQMNGELNKAIEVRVRTSQTGTTATGTDIAYVKIRTMFYACGYRHIVMYMLCYELLV